MNNISLQLIYNSLHADSFRHVDLNILSDIYDVNMNGRGVYFTNPSSHSCFKIGEITKDKLMFIRNLCENFTWFSIKDSYPIICHVYKKIQIY